MTEEVNALTEGMAAQVETRVFYCYFIYVTTTLRRIHIFFRALCHFSQYTEAKGPR
jgi:hypothetical protein